MNEAKLKNLTKRHWDKLRDEPENTEEILKTYITDLLPGELTWAEEHPVIETGNSRIPKRGCDELILLVGFSIEPLLQSVWVYNPRYVVLLLNSDYCGQNAETFGKIVWRLIEHLHATRKNSFQETRDAITVIMRELPPEPSPVFHELRQIVSPPDQAIEDLRGEIHSIETLPEQVVIDITGGKKKMVAEAFLYAAYANIDVSYVDFDDDRYDESYRRPYGYCCRIGRLKNPYSAFALRDWERVRDLYDKYHFRAAKTALAELQNNLRNAEMSFLVDDMQDATQKFDTLLDCYAAWDSGDFNKAKNYADTIDWVAAFPSVITAFDGKWFTPKETRNGIAFQKSTTLQNFYDDTKELRIYIFDELARARRLWEHEEYRSSFLQAAGLNEIIMVARLVRLIQNDHDRQQFLQALQDQTPKASTLYEVLLKSRYAEIKIGTPQKDKKFDISFTGAPELVIPRPAPMKEWWQGTKYFQNTPNNRPGWRIFLDLRNDITHAYFTLPGEWAEDALQFVKANFEDFVGMSIEALQASLDLSAERLAWEEACAQCGLDKALPLNLRRNP